MSSSPRSPSRGRYERDPFRQVLLGLAGLVFNQRSDAMIDAGDRLIALGESLSLAALDKLAKGSAGPTGSA